MARLTTKERKRVRRFAWPEWKAEPLEDAAHVRDAEVRFMQVRTPEGNVPSDSQRDAAWRNIERSAKDFGVTLTKKSWRELKASVCLLASAITFADSKIPNHHPFEGVLCVLDEPSTMAPDGSSGNRVVMTKALAEKLGPTLVGQPVDLTDNFQGHGAKKVGVIDGWEIRAAKIDGRDKEVLGVNGHLWSRDFPTEVSQIQAFARDMGMSFELDRPVMVEDPSFGPKVARITDAAGFFGAAILLKRAAAYQTTSLAASAAEKGSTAMSEELKALLASTLGDFKTDILAEVRKTVRAAAKKTGREKLEDDLKEAHEMHSKAKDLHDDLGDKVDDLDDQADGAEEVKAAHEKLGDHLKAMAKHIKAMKADAADGNYHEPDDEPEAKERGKEEEKGEDEAKEKGLKAAQAEIASLKAQLANGAMPPARITKAPAGELLAKAGMSLSEGEKATPAHVQQALNTLKITDPAQRTAALLRSYSDQASSAS